MRSWRWNNLSCEMFDPPIRTAHAQLGRPRRHCDRAAASESQAATVPRRHGPDSLDIMPQLLMMRMEYEKRIESNFFAAEVPGGCAAAARRAALRLAGARRSGTVTAAAAVRGLIGEPQLSLSFQARVHN